MKLLKILVEWCQRTYWNGKFRSVGRGSRVESPLRVQGGRNIVIGDQVKVGKLCWLAAMPLTSSDKTELRIGNGCQIGDFNHLFATGSIVFEDEVLTANHVYITDNLHGYSDVDAPIMHQPIRQLKPVVLGAGCWIGENVSIIGASIGRNSVVGANSVVTHDVPDRCVAVGAPAKIIKRYNTQSKIWENVI